MNNEREQMNIVIVGHVDHGKSTVIGRLLSDTGSLPKGKLAQVRRNCEQNSKPFEYAFLLDALKDEQAQGITIDTARCFFNTAKRHYIIIDAPGHIEFLKNMITGAARAEAALLVIDAKEGVKENSRRHGFMLSLLGINQIVVLVNKMDLADYRQDVFEQIKDEYLSFLKQIKVEPRMFVPISAREGDNLTTGRSGKMPWYKGPSVLELIDGFTKEKQKEQQAFRFPVQDIYKFTENHDDRRIMAGTIETGTVRVGDEVVFLPSQKRSVIQSIEGFNEPVRSEIGAGYATGFTLKTQVYIKPGEIMCRLTEEMPKIATAFKANIFWMGKSAMVQSTKYKMKIGANRATVYLKEIIHVLDAGDLSTRTGKDRIERHDVAECVLQTLKPIAFDLSRDIEATGRFVIIDNYEIVGGGIITGNAGMSDSLLQEYIAGKESMWDRSSIPPDKRAARFGQNPRFILIAGKNTGKSSAQTRFAKALEEDLFKSGYNVYYLGISELYANPGSSIKDNWEDREASIKYIGELARFFFDAGLIFITSIPDLDDSELELLKELNEPYEVLIISRGPSVEHNYPVALYIDEKEEMGTAVEKAKRVLQLPVG